MKRAENERNQTKNIKVNGARRVPTANEDKQPNEQIQHADGAKRIFGAGRLFGRRSDERSLKALAAAKQFVAHLGPKTGAPQTFRHLDLGGDRGAVDGYQYVARAYAYSVRRGVRGHLPRLGALGGVHPGYAVVGTLKTLPLDEIQPGKDHRRQRC